MFPFPLPDELRTVDTTDVSDFEVGLLEREWKAKSAVRDDALVRKLCDSLENILGDTALSAKSKRALLATFSPRLEDDEWGQNEEWEDNSSEAQSRTLLNIGVYRATRACLFLYGHHRFVTDKESLVEGGSSKVDYVVLVDNDMPAVLCEANSPSVMHEVGQVLPERGIELKWSRGQSLIQKILTNAALYLGLRRMEWLFLTCHNYWIVCRLVKDDDHPFLAYSPKISIKDSSEPFRAFLGAILSVLKGAHIEPSTFNPDIQLDTIIEDTDERPLPEDDIGDHSGAHPGSSSKGRATESMMTRPRTCAGHDNAEPGLMITSSSPSSPESFQVWVRLQALTDNTLALPVPDRNGQRRLWLTRFIGFGSTGKVWKGHFDDNDDSFAVKIVELLRPSDTDSRQRLRNEFNVYLKIEAAYQSKRLRDRITPHCYGAFEGDGVDALVLDLCDGILHTWNELSAAELAQVFKLVQDLHGIGIVHGDLEPRNVMRAPGGGFFLIDFSQSRKHICKEYMVDPSHNRRFATIQNEVCFELQTLRNSLWNSKRR